MKVKIFLRKSLSLLLALSVILSMGVGAFAAPAKTATKAAELGDYGSTKTIYTGADYYDDDFSIRLDAFQNSSASTSATGVPLDIAIVFDRSQSMSQPASTSASEYKSFKSYYPGAILYQDPTYGWWTFDHEDIVESTSIKNEIEKINDYLATLNKDAYEGYYRATNYLKRGVPYFQNNHEGFAAEGFASWEPLRYNKSTSKWEMRVTKGLWGGDFPAGINTMDFTTGSIACKQVEWMSVTEAYKEYCARNRRNIYTGKQVYPGNPNKQGYTGYYDFVIATPRLSKAIDATETFIRDVYEHNKTLPSGKKHKVSLLSFSSGALYVGGQYIYKQYDKASDSAIYIEDKPLADELGVSMSGVWMDSETNLNDLIKTLRSHYTYMSTRTDWALEAVESNSDYLPDPDDSRKQVVILVTDGAPTNSDNMELSVTNDALAAANKLKQAGVEVYTVGFMPNLNQGNAPQAFINSNKPADNAVNANSFLKSCSSMYPGATAMGKFGDMATDEVPYYQADDGTGDKLAEIFEIMKEYIFKTDYAGYFKDVKHLSIYDEITGEFKLDGQRPITVYAYPYEGNNTFGDMEKLAEHSFTVPTEETPSSVTGSGYNIQLSDNNGTIKVQLNWSDAKYAFLRESEYATGGLYDTQFPKGYKIMLDLPIEVDRTETLGGNNIPTNRSRSGFYKPDESGSDTGVGDNIISYEVPNVNVKFEISSEIYDYFMDLKDYAEKFQDPDLNGEDAEAVFQAMYQTIDDLKELLSGHMNDYVHIDLELFNALGQLLDGWHAEAGADSFNNVDAAEGAKFDFMVDQILTFLITMTPKTDAYDSCADANNGDGVEPYDPVSMEYHPNYYGPKYVVVDFDETVKTPLDKEGGLSPELQTNVKNGKIEGTNLCYDFRATYGSGNKSYLEQDYTTVGYQVTAINGPKGMEPNDAGQVIVPRNFYVIPANVMTYDDTFLKYDNNGWTVGTPTDTEQSHENTVIHGYDSIYEGNYSKEYYHNALSKVTVTDTKGIAKADFTICGTGFDIFAQTSPDTGAMTVQVSKDSSFNDVYKTILVDTYLSDTTLNQIPVVRVDGLEYRTWYIRITAFYDKIFDHNYTIIQTGKNAIFTEESLRDRYDIPEDMDFTFIPSASGYDKAPTRGTVVVFSGKYDIRIDGIRVYNTLGTSLDKVETYAYAQAGEGVANIINVNDSLVDATNANAWADSAVSGINGVLYTAASSSTSTETAVTDGIIMGMEGLLYTNPKLPTDGTKPDSATRYYVFEDAALKTNVKFDGKNVYFRVQEITSSYDRTYQGLNYYNDGNTSTPMSMQDVKAAFGGKMPVYYNAKYSQYGPEKEVYLNSTNGVAFKVGTGAKKVMISLKSNNGNTASLNIYNPATKGFVRLADTSSRVEMYHDITSYVNDQGFIYLKNAGGITAVCNIKTIGVPFRGITVDRDLMEWVQEIDASTLPVDGSAEIMHSLDLASDISLNYVVPTAKLADYDKSFMEVSFKGETFAIEPEIRGDYGYFTVTGITAVDMTEKLTATLHMFLGEEEFVSETDIYSVADYAYTQLGKADVSDELKAVCANLLRYGAQAQSFKGSENAPADVEMTPEQKAYLTDLNTVSVESCAKALGDVENGIAWAGKVLVLDSKVAVKAVFNLKDFAGNKNELNLHVTYTNTKGEEVALVIDTMEAYNADAQQYAFVIDSLLATEMRSVLTMALYEGDTQVSETQLYSVESYCVGKPGALADLGKALLAYSDAAKAFFAK